MFTNFERKFKTRSSPKWRLHIHVLCFIGVHSFSGLAKAVRLFIASFHSQPMYPKMCSIDIFVDLRPVNRNLKGGLFNPLFDARLRDFKQNPSTIVVFAFVTNYAVCDVQKLPAGTSRQNSHPYLKWRHQLLPVGRKSRWYMDLFTVILSNGFSINAKPV